MATNFAQIIGNVINTQENMKSGMVKPGVINTYFVLNNWRIIVRSISMLLESRSLGTAFILDHSVNGLLDAGKILDGSVGSYSTIESNATTLELTNAYKEELAKCLVGDSVGYPTHFEIGTGTTAYSISQTSLVTASGARVSSTNTNSTTKQTQFQGLFSDRADANIKEVGLFNASSSGDMVIRYVLSSEVDMSVSSDYRFTIKITYTDNTPGNALVNTTGLNEMRDWMYDGATGTAPTYTEWNDSTEDVDAAHNDTDWDTGGGNEQRNAFVSNSGTRATYKVSWRCELTTAQLNGVNVTKSGLFNSAAGATLWSESEYGPINKTTLFKVLETDSITII